MVPCGICDLPGPEIEPVSRVLAGRFLTTRPPGKSSFYFSNDIMDGSLRVLLPASRHRDHGGLLGIFPNPSDPIHWSNRLSSSPPDPKAGTRHGWGREVRL